MSSLIVGKGALLQAHPERMAVMKRHCLVSLSMTAVLCAAAVAGVPSANTAVSAVHARARIVVLKRLPSCTGFSPQSGCGQTKLFYSGLSITNALSGCQAAKPMKTGTSVVFVVEAEGVAELSSNLRIIENH